MNKQIKILLAGVFVLIPFGVTVWVILWVGEKLAAMGYALVDKTPLTNMIPEVYWPFIGVGFVLVIIYFVGLLTRLVLFKKMLKLLEQILTHLPGIKTVYESIRDLMQLFGGDKSNMGKVVLYTPPDMKIKMLGIMTNENPKALESQNGEKLVAVYLPLGYMIGGPVVYAAADELEEIDMSVEAAMKLAVTANIGLKSDKAKSVEMDNSAEQNKEAMDGEKSEKEIQSNNK